MVVSGGPPCQPSSLGGKHKGFLDQRDVFPEAVRAVRELRPMRLHIRKRKRSPARDVRGVFRIHQPAAQLSIAYSALQQDTGRTIVFVSNAIIPRGSIPSEYNVVYRLLNAADYGVPQRRERVFLVGFRSDLGVHWSFPEQNHSEDSLLRDQWIVGDYWDKHRVARRKRPTLTPRQTARVEKLQSMLIDGKLPWLTVRDAVGNLPEPANAREATIANHIFNPGAGEEAIQGIPGVLWMSPRRH